MQSIPIKAKYVRRFPDPVLKQSERHVLLCSVQDVPPGLPKEPNPRQQKIDRGIWNDIREHLLNEDGTANTFHLKNKGITLLATEVVKNDEENYTLKFSPGEGLVDGGHTYELILNCQKEIAEFNAANPENQVGQFVKIEVLTGLPPFLTAEIAGGLNTSIQVQATSLENLKGSFDWIKDELKGEPYFEKIAFRENEGRAYDVRYIIALLDLFNISDFPNTMNAGHPVRAYTSKSDVLDAYVEHTENFEKLRPILKDILKLHDIISSSAPELYNEAGRRAKEEGTGMGAKAGRLTFVDAKQRGEYEFVFINENGTKRLANGALMPMLAAFRWLVEADKKTGKVRWRGGFENVKRLWKRAAAELMRRTQMTSLSVDRKVNAIGRNAQHWAQLYDFLVRAEMEASRDEE